MPLLRITCRPDETTRLVTLLADDASAVEIAVVPGVGRPSGSDLIVADVPRGVIDTVIDRVVEPGAAEGLRISVEPSERLFPEAEGDVGDSEAVVWTQVTQDVHETGRLSWVNVLLVVTAAMIAAVGIIENQLLLIVGAMALSPDYFMIADTCLSSVRRDRHRVLQGLRTLAVSYTAGAVCAWILTEVLTTLDIVELRDFSSRQLILFISQPDTLSIVVAALAGIAGALAITLPDARGLVGVFVSVTTIPAAANIGVALAAHNGHAMVGAGIQLLVNVFSVLVVGAITLEIRHRLHRSGTGGIRR